ncbi:MAG: hypothetical protein IBJ05_09230, partial [Blastomonas sp.]|nr:hypothetical protein [Blastomonas sp.]
MKVMVYSLLSLAFERCIGSNMQASKPSDPRIVPADAAGIARAAAMLHAGQIVALPTETV